MNSMLRKLPQREYPPPKDADTGTKGLPGPSVLRILANWAGHKLEVRSLRRLLAMDQRILADLGLERSDLLAEYRRLSTTSWTTRSGFARKQPVDLRPDRPAPASLDQGGYDWHDGGLLDAHFAMLMLHR
jgi:uncharacterized protein YjiS (DUF1127 family)